jgi:hypothetical protein
MARILYTGIVSDIKGSISGTTFQHNASGRIAKARSNQRFSSSSLQSGTQAQFATVAARWRDLALFDRESWDDMAFEYDRVDKWGNHKTISGYQYHALSNRNLLTIGEPMQDAPAAYVTPLQVQSYDVTTDATHFTINFTAPFNLANYTLLVFASPPTQKSHANSRVMRRLICQETGITVEDLEIMPNYIAVYPLNWASLFAGGHCLIHLFLCTVANATGMTSQFSIYQEEIG